MKVLKNSLTLSDSSSEVQRGLREVHALSALNTLQESHNIVRYYSGWIQNGQLHVVVILHP